MKKLEPIVAAHKNAKFASKRAIHDQMAPITTVIANIQLQLVEYRRVTDLAFLADEDPAADAKVEHFRQTFSALDREVTAFAEAARNVARGMSQLDRYIAQAEVAISAANRT